MMTRIAGIDFGLKRIGFALSDPFHLTASPKETFLNNDGFRDNLLNELQKNNVSQIVIGLPPETKNNKKLIVEIKDLNNFLTEKDYKCVYIDESFTSKRAMNQMITSGKKKKFRQEKSNLDSFAAAIILTDYLEEKQ